AVEEPDIRPRTNRQVNIRELAGCGSARIDDDDLEIGSPRLRFRNTLEEDRVTPRGVRADEDHQLGEVEILVAKGNEILAERTLVAGHRRGHAQPRVRIDVRRTDESLHQLVRDVV